MLTLVLAMHHFQLCPAVHLFSLYVLMTKKMYNVPKYLFKKANIFQMYYLCAGASGLPWRSGCHADYRVNIVVLHSKSYVKVGEVSVPAELHNLAKFIALMV